MKKREMNHFIVVFVLTAFIVVSLSGVCAASETKMPRVMNVIGHGVGSKLYGLAAGFAKVGSKNLPTEFKVVPTSGPAEWMPMAREGEVDLAAVISFDGKRWRLFPTQNPIQLRSGRVLAPVTMIVFHTIKHLSCTSHVLPGFLELHSK